MKNLPTFPALEKNSLESLQSLVPYSSFAPRRSCYTKVENSSFPGPFNHILVHSSCQEIKSNSSRGDLGAPGASQKNQPAPPSWIYWEYWEHVEAPAQWWLMFIEDFVTWSPCDSSGSSHPSNCLHSLFQSHPSAPGIPFPSGILIPGEEPALEEPGAHGKAPERTPRVPSSMLSGDTWERPSRVSHWIPEAPTLLETPPGAKDTQEYPQPHSTLVLPHPIPSCSARTCSKP